MEGSLSGNTHQKEAQQEWAPYHISYQVITLYSGTLFQKIFNIFFKQKQAQVHMQPSPFQIEAIGKTDRFTNNCFYLNGSWYWRGIFPVKYHEIPQKHVSLPTPTPFFHPMTPVWDRSPADWGWPQSSKQHKFEFEESRIAKLWSCSTCLAMLHNAHFREGSYSFVVKH